MDNTQHENNTDKATPITLLDWQMKISFGQQIHHKNFYEHENMIKHYKDSSCPKTSFQSTSFVIGWPQIYPAIRPILFQQTLKT